MNRVRELITATQLKASHQIMQCSPAVIPYRSTNDRAPSHFFLASSWTSVTVISIKKRKIWKGCCQKVHTEIQWLACILWSGWMNVAGSILTESISPLAWFALVKSSVFIWTYWRSTVTRVKRKIDILFTFGWLSFFVSLTDTFIKKQDRLEGGNIKPISVNSCINDER